MKGVQKTSIFDDFQGFTGLTRGGRGFKNWNQPMEERRRGDKKNEDLCRNFRNVGVT